jgi:hypothetical protein
MFERRRFKELPFAGPEKDEILRKAKKAGGEKRKTRENSPELQPRSDRHPSRCCLELPCAGRRFP